MPDRENTDTEDYRLVNLMVDGTPVEFIRATVTRTTLWAGGAGARVREMRWHGEIATVTYKPNIDDAIPVHDLVAETADGHVVEGHFTVTSWHGQGFEIAGRGELTIT